MTLFEAGILSKMTTDEYRNLPEHSRRSDPVTESEAKESNDAVENTGAAQTQTESTIGLRPVSLTMFQGAFCILGMGYFLAAVALAAEWQIHRRKMKQRTIKPIEKTTERRTARMMLLKNHLYRIFGIMYVVIDRALQDHANA